MEDFATASAAANSNAAILQRLLLAQQQQQQQQQQALQTAASPNTTVAANALLLEQIRRSQLVAAAAGVLGSGNVQAGSGSCSGSGSALWEQQQRQMLLLLLQQQRQQNIQQYMQAIALANLNSKVAAHATLDAAALRVHQQQQQLQALNALLANANSATAASASSDFRLPAHNLAPVSAHKRGNSIDGGSSPLRNSPRAVHEFSASWPASECDSPSSPMASAFADSADSFEPLPSEEEFEMHLMTVQTSYFSQE
ncbi:hypothetical protein CLOM_g13052 [Closterium sp. NIES-68]|nr:hypothetical protein CLOM_g13052 [Closterium sp. NIES-68]GJP86215.1 hypothetical protein CLOP_g16265 [Closterium sp. NIES-67]